MTDHNQLRANQEKSEQEHDAAVTKLHRIQSQLSNKATQVKKLPPDEYRAWLVERKVDLGLAQDELQAKKIERAEARRKFNGWEPQVKETWLGIPDETGWWWCYDGIADELSMFVVSACECVGCRCQSQEEAHLMVTDAEGVPWRAGELSEHNDLHLCVWKYQEEPDLP